MQVDFRVVRRAENRRVPGYLEPEKVYFQDLIRTVNGRSEVVDTEEVPVHALISLGCFGDTGGWQSKWAKLVGVQRDLARASASLLQEYPVVDGNRKNR